MPTLRAVTLLEAGHTAEWAAKEAVRAMLRVDPDADGAIFVFRKNKTVSCFSVCLLSSFFDLPLWSVH